jgi:ATP-dependent protease ClpP protease subunit
MGASKERAMKDVSEAPSPFAEEVPSISVSPSSVATQRAQDMLTPMYEAIHAPRRHRQALIKAIEAESGRRLICYVSGRTAAIDRDDAAGFMDVLHNVRPDENVDLLLHTRGGDVDAAEKLMALMQATVASAQLRIIIPDFAKSAGTLMALGADTLIMSDSSELGTIDPQIWSDDGRGNEICHSVLSYLDAFKRHSEALRENPADPVARLMLDKLDPTTQRHFEAVRERARHFAEDQLKRKGRNFSQIAAALLDITRWLSHGQMIKWQDVRELGLPVEYLPPRSDRWQSYWRLYCLLRLAVRDKQNIFESRCTSLILDQ